MGAAFWDRAEASQNVGQNLIHHLVGKLHSDGRLRRIPIVIYRFQKAFLAGRYAEGLSGTLYVVATPIGNLEDITYRAVRLLKECDLVACEDTRRTQKLLQHYGITKPMVSLHEHNESDRAADLLEKLTDGVNIALVSDAGTPLISDPGYRLVREAVEKRLPVVPVPGASSILSALAAAGLKQASIALTGRNLFTFTKYSGQDPESGTANVRIDDLAYPRYRTISLRTQLTF